MDAHGPDKTSWHPGGDVQLPHPGPDAVIGSSDRAGSLKCWVIFENMFFIHFEVRAQCLLTLGQTCKGVTRTPVTSGRCSNTLSMR